MLENKKFTVDRVTPILVSILMGSLLLILIVGGLSNLFRPTGAQRGAEVDENDEDENEDFVGGGAGGAGGAGGEDYVSVQSSRRRVVRSGGVARRTRKQEKKSKDMMEAEEEGSLLTSLLSADAIS